jgi:uncharacterized protein (DUF433 family)
MRQLDRITIDPLICLGQPTNRGMRITVGVILKTLAAGRSVAEVLAAYPELDEQDVRQANAACRLVGLRSASSRRIRLGRRRPSGDRLPSELPGSL